MADILGVDPRTVEARVKEGMPYLRRPGEGDSKEWQFDTVDVIEWLTGRIDSASKNDEVKEAKARIAIADAGLKELELTDKLGITFTVDDIRPPWQEALTIFKSRIMTIPGRLAQTLAFESDAPTVERLIKAEINAALTDLQIDSVLQDMKNRKDAK